MMEVADKIVLGGIALAIITAASLITGYYIERMHIIEASADPIATACAMDVDSTHQSAICIIYALKKEDLE